MVPTLIVLGLLCGRWWAWALAVAAVGWPLALFLTGVMDIEWGLAGAAALAIANTAVGVSVHQGALWIVRQARA